MMRLFVGLEPDAAFRGALAELQELLRGAGVAGRWLEPSNLHLTLAFIGMWPEPVTEVLPPVEEAFTLTLAHPGVFPEAKVLWAGVEPCPALDRMAESTRRALAEAEIPFDGQRFTPHITLARRPAVPEGVDLAAFEVPRAVMRVRQVCLFRSERRKSGMVYSVIGRGEGGGTDEPAG